MLQKWMESLQLRVGQAWKTAVDPALSRKLRVMLRYTVYGRLLEKEKMTDI